MMGKDLGRDENGNKLTHGGRSLIPEGTVRDGVNGPTGEDKKAPATSRKNSHGTVSIDRTTWQRMKDFCDSRGWQIKFMGSKALNEWMDRIEQREFQDAHDEQKGA